jgi:hypothetical protein
MTESIRDLDFLLALLRGWQLNISHDGEHQGFVRDSVVAGLVVYLAAEVGSPAKDGQ